jgi:NADH-quinone oxidoreductase subunit N
MSFLFLNVEFLFLLNICLLIIFILSSNLFSSFRYLLELKSLRVDYLVRNLVNFSVFFFFTLINLLFYLYDKRFFWFDLMVYNDNFIIFSKFLVLFSASLILIFSTSYFHFEVTFKSFEYFILFLLSVLGMFFLLSSNDFLSLYLTIELQSLALYVLASFKQNSILSIEAGLKYFILGTFSSGLLLFGISFIYGFTGLTNFFEIDLLFQQNFNLRSDPLVSLGILFFLAAIMFKFTAVPFHMWAPDVYHGSPTIITFFFSMTPKIVFFSLLLRLVLLVFSGFELHYKVMFFFCSFLSLLIGSLASLYQNKLKRLLAYSSISNVGYALVALLCGQIEALTSGFFFFLVYIFVLTGIFSVLLGLRQFHNFFKVTNIYSFLGVLNSNSLLGFILVINLFSLLGLPPLAGFLSKFYLFFNMIGSEFFLLFFVSVLSSILSAAIYLKMVRLVLFNKYNNIFFYVPVQREFAIIMAITLIFNFFIFFYSGIILKLIYNIILAALKLSIVYPFIF